MTPTENEAFWGYEDVLLFIGLALPSGALAALIGIGLGKLIGVSKPFRLLLIQLIWYALVFGTLWLILRLRYGRPFWSSLGWRARFPGVSACIFGGPLMAVGIGLLAYVIRTPVIKLPFDQMLVDRPTTVLFSLFAVVIGPVCEELAFRGFLMPLFIRSVGVASGILGTAILFGSLHAAEYEWSWRHVLLITIVGCILGTVRYRTRSTAGSTLLHATYNLTQLAVFLTGKDVG
jgi:membrane protease YdiL (CAAX protease family)